MTDLAVDEHRLEALERGEFRETGILVRAALDGQWGNYDIITLTRASLLAWLQSRGGSNPWAENTVLILLGHDA